ncbi:chemotaxis protein CheC [Bacillus piscicola]|uniref:chemotaxis protein CheC n=1 Tax=Bacillus piscicola TaxID=1632684 RepID=UPI001F09DB7E|nr:chemotaxis protein CheC [Bacillus piscicola]
MELIQRIQPLHLDVLKEAGNIGAGNAATALSSLLNKTIDMKVPAVRVVSFQEVQALAGGAETLVVAAFLRITGEAPGSMFLILQKSEAEHLAAALTGQRVDIGNDDLEEMAVSALQETSNILAGSYLSALSDFTSINMQPSVPALAIDMAGALLDAGFVEMSQVGDYAIVIDTVMEEPEKTGESASIGQFFLLPDPDAFRQIFRALGVNMP